MTITATRSKLGLRTLAAALAALSIGLIAPATSARASVTSANGTVSALGTCNRYNHTFSLNSSIVLSSRFPRGTTVAVRYAYYAVNASRQAITGITTTGWQTAFVPSSTIVVGDLYIGNNATRLPGLAYSNTWGHYIVMAQVGVWNGSYYEYSAWDTAQGYDNYGQYGIYSYNNVCLASMT